MKSKFSNSFGMSLVEMIMVMGIMSMISLVMASMMINQGKSNNFIDYQMKRTQLRSALIGQFLSNSSNCKCLFFGSAEFAELDTTMPGITLSVSPAQITNYSFVTPGDCATATADPNPFISTSATINDMRATAIQMKNVRWDGSAYSGDLSVNMTSMKDVAGPKEMNLSIRVGIQTSPGTPGNVQFSGCAMTSASGVTPVLGTCPAGQVLIGYNTLNGNMICQPPTYQ